jgi:hypothetical protein
MGFRENYLFARDDAAFQEAVTAALVRCSLDINGEAKGEQSDALWKARSRLAHAVWTDAAGIARRFTLAMKMDNPSLTGDSSDGALYSGVIAMWNHIAVAQADT